MLIFKTFKAQIPTSCSERQAHFSFKWGSFSGIRGSALLCGTTFRRSTNQQPKTNKQTTNQRTDPKKSRRQRALGERGAYRVRTLQVQRQIQRQIQEQVQVQVQEQKNTMSDRAIVAVIGDDACVTERFLVRVLYHSYKWVIRGL